MTVPFIFVVGSLGNYLEFLGYGIFFINALGINVLRGIIRNYAELFSFFEPGVSLPAEQAFSIGTYQSRPRGLDWCVYSRGHNTNSRAALAVLLNTGMAFTGCLRGVCVALKYR